MERPLINKKFRLEKMPGKGGWVYVLLPRVLEKNEHLPFGWVKVKGTIDGYPFDNYPIMPTKEGQLFLPVKATIRKAIGKNEGDLVHVILYADMTPVPIRK